MKKVRWSMLLSHHPPTQYCRTYKVGNMRICARCLGIPIGIFACCMYENIPSVLPLWVYFLMPIPTFLNFLLQELNLIPSLNLLKTFLTILLGFYIYFMFKHFYEEDFVLALGLLFYLLLIEVIVVLILGKFDKIEGLINEYEKGVVVNELYAEDD